MKLFISFSILLSALPFCGTAQQAIAQPVGVAPTAEISPETMILAEANALAYQARYENREKLLLQIQGLKSAEPTDKARKLAVVSESLSRADFGASNARAFDLSLQLAQRAIDSADFGLANEIWMLIDLNNESAQLPRSPQQKTALAAMILHSLQRIKQLKGDGPSATATFSSPPISRELLSKLPFFFSGMSPANIADPETRAQYEAAIAKNNFNIGRDNDYHEAQRWENIWGDAAEKSLRDFAATSEGAAALNTLLQTYDIDANSVARIKHAPAQ